MNSVLLSLAAEDLFLFGEPWWRGNHKDSSDASRQRRVSIESFLFFTSSPSSGPETETTNGSVGEEIRN